MKKIVQFRKLRFKVLNKKKIESNCGHSIFKFSKTSCSFWRECFTRVHSELFHFLAMFFLVVQCDKTEKEKVVLVWGNDEEEEDGKGRERGNVQVWCFFAALRLTRWVCARPGRWLFGKTSGNQQPNNLHAAAHKKSSKFCFQSCAWVKISALV